MFENLLSNVIAANVPDLTYTLPLIGEYNFKLIVTAASIFIALNIFFWLLRKIIIVRVSALSERTSTDIDDVVVNAVKSIRSWVYSIVSIYVAVKVFPLSEQVDLVLTGIFLFAIVWQFIKIANTFVGYFAARFLERDGDGDGVIDPGAATASNMVTLIASIVMWVFGGIFVLSNLGIEVTSLIAGLGIGGIAVAFALQGILSDLFASFSIYFDKPFRIGDFIVVGTDKGTVEKIGIKSTRLRTLQGEELVISNAELTTARVQNFKKMEERRVATTIGIAYETPYDLVESLPQIITEAFESFEGGRLDRVYFTNFGDSALIYEIVYFIESAEMTDYLDVQQRFNLQLFKTFTEKGVEFAYPTQTIYTKAG